MSHNKERRSKRDEKLDKKSQAMEELKAEREKKKNKTGECDRVSLFFFRRHVNVVMWHFSLLLTLKSLLFIEQRSSWPNVSPWRQVKFTLTMKRRRRKMTTSHQSKVIGVHVHHLTTMTSKYSLVSSVIGGKIITGRCFKPLNVFL